MSDNFLPDEELNQILKIVIEVGNKLTNQPNSNENLNVKYAEGLGQKILGHALTVNYLYEGYQPRTKNEIFAPQVDFSSMCVLARACFEAYLTFNYLFIAPKTDLERDFKFLCWDLGGYLDREDFPASTEEYKVLKEAERKEIEQLRKVINSHTYLTPEMTKQKELALDGQWRLKNSWSKIAVSAGFKEKFFNIQYSFLCGHSHSSRLSIIQVQQTKDINIQRNVTKATLNLLKMILSKYIFEYTNLVPALKNSVNFDTQDYAIIRIYKTLAETMDN